MGATSWTVKVSARISKDPVPSAQRHAAAVHLLQALFALSATKVEEVQFAVGEALCHVFGGTWPSADPSILGIPRRDTQPRM